MVIIPIEVFMSKRKRHNRYDKYGIYEIPNYNQKRKKRKKKKASLGGVVKLLLLIWVMILLLYIVVYCVKYSMKSKALSLYDEADYQGAVELFDEALNPRLPFLNTFDNDIRYYMADCYVNMEDYDLACHQYAMIRFWSEKADDRAKYLGDIAYGLLLYKWKDYRQALPILQKAYEDGYGELILYVGSCYGQTGDLDNMQLYYNIFLQNHDMNSFMYAQYASIALDEDDLDTAYEYIEKGKILEDQSNFRELLFDEIVYYEKIKDYNTAFEKAEEYIEKYPGDVDGQKEYDLLYTRQTVTSK